METCKFEIKLSEFGIGIAPNLKNEPRLDPEVVPESAEEMGEILKLLDKDFDGKYSLDEFEETMGTAQGQKRV